MMDVAPPKDWSDHEGWDRYLSERLESDDPPSASGALRFAEFALSRGGKVWFSGCGVDLAPFALASVGCEVLATDISRIAVERQLALATRTPEEVFPDWAEASGELNSKGGLLTALRHDFASEPLTKQFDVVINSRAFHGLTPALKQSAAGNFKAGVRPGGALIMDTLNVQGRDRDAIEEPLVQAGFYIPFFEIERWYRNQLEATGIVYAMILGRPMIPHWGQYPEESFAEFKDRDQRVLAAFRTEYDERRKSQEESVRTTLADRNVLVAHVIYSTG